MSKEVNISFCPSTGTVLRNYQVPTEGNSDKKELPSLISGVDLYEIVAPVSKSTGHRNNPLDCIGMVLDPAKARALETVLKEFPSSGAPSDEGTFEYLASRLDTGTDAERELYVNALQKVADSLLAVQPALKDGIDKENNISFEKSDSNNGAE